MDKFEEAVEILEKGGIIIFPTDTAFGIGCRLDKPQAIDRLFKIRRRPLTQPTPVLVVSPEMALTYFNNPPNIVRLLMNKYWPGGLTIVSACNKKLVYSPVRGGSDNIGLRMPKHAQIIKLIEKVGVPILAPSANFHKSKTPFSYDELDPELTKLVDLVIPGECKTKKASTVVDCSVIPWKITREGAVNILL